MNHNVKQAGYVAMLPKEIVALMQQAAVLDQRDAAAVAAGNRLEAARVRLAQAHAGATHGEFNAAVAEWTAAFAANERQQSLLGASSN